MLKFSRRAALSALLGSAAVAVAPRSVWALEPSVAEDFVRSVAERLVALIQSSKTFSEKRVALRDLLNDTAAMPQIARYALGTPWRSMSDPQKAEYLELFPQYVSLIYARRFDEYQGETLEVVGSRDRGAKGVFVETQVARPGAQPLQVEWRVSDRAGPVQIVDIYVEGVSLLTTQREDFKGQLDSSGGDVAMFLARLRELAAG